MSDSDETKPGNPVRTAEQYQPEGKLISNRKMLQAKTWEWDPYREN
jgi:hypothetical protein